MKLFMINKRACKIRNSNEKSKLIQCTFTFVAKDRHERRKKAEKPRKEIIWRYAA